MTILKFVDKWLRDSSTYSNDLNFLFAVEQFLTFRAFLDKSATPPPLDPLGTLCNIYPVGQSSRVVCES